MNISQSWISDYIAFCRYHKGLSEKTIKAYEEDLSQLNAFLVTVEGDCDKKNLQSYLVMLHGKYKPRTVKRKVASMKAFFNYLEEEGLFYPNPVSKMRIKLHEPHLLPRTISLSTIEQLLKFAYSEKEKHQTNNGKNTALRDVAVLELLFATGMRVSEICSLGCDSVDLAEKTIMIYGKGAKERIIQIGNNDVFAIVCQYHRAFEEQISATGFFFVNRLGKRLSEQSVRFMIKRYANLAGIESHITPHMFRHTFATLLLEEDVDIRYIQQLLGHSSITTTQIYTHVASKKQRDILTAKNPRNTIIV